MKELRSTVNMVCIVFVFCAAAAIPLPAQFTTLHEFGPFFPPPPRDGAAPTAGLTQASDGNFYGTTTAGADGFNCQATGGCGTVFKISPVYPYPETVLYSFCPGGQPCSDGDVPFAGLVQGSDGNFYGTTEFGGGGGTCITGGELLYCGTVFKMSPSGGPPIWQYGFTGTGTDGSNPQAGLVQGRDGNFYGTTVYGGGSGTCSIDPGGPNIYCGTVFKIPPSGGTPTILYSFAGGSDSANSYAGLVQGQGADKNFYGTTAYGGGSGTCSIGPGGPNIYCGTVFKISPVYPYPLTILHRFAGGSDGANPYAGLVLASDGNLYGTTYAGGGMGVCNNPQAQNVYCGTVFKIPTTGGPLTILHSFTATLTDGAKPYAGLIEASDGNFYGTTLQGGGNGLVSCTDDGCGTVFKISPVSPYTLTTLHSFPSEANCADGTLPYDRLVQAKRACAVCPSDRTLYGTTSECGLHGGGTVFRLVPTVR